MVIIRVNQDHIHTISLHRLFRWTLNRRIYWGQVWPALRVKIRYTLTVLLRVRFRPKLGHLSFHHCPIYYHYRGRGHLKHGRGQNRGDVDTQTRGAMRHRHLFPLLQYRFHVSVFIQYAYSNRQPRQLEVSHHRP